MMSDNKEMYSLIKSIISGDDCTRIETDAAIYLIPKDRLKDLYLALEECIGEKTTLGAYLN